MEIKIEKKEVSKKEYYNVFYYGNYYNIKKEDIQNNLNIKKVGKKNIIEYIKKYYM